MRISSEFLDFIGLSNLFDDIERIEILQAYQFDQTNFFSLQKITIKIGALSRINDIINKTFNANAKSFELIEQKDNEITCIMQQSRKEGFWPLFFEPFQWGFIPPISVDKESILITIITQNVQKLHKEISKVTQNYDILAQSDVKTISQNRLLIPYPKFTKRQKEIAVFAVRNGYFDSPKKINAESIAKKFKRHVSTINEHLRNATRLALEYFF